VLFYQHDAHMAMESLQQMNNAILFAKWKTINQEAYDFETASAQLYDICCCGSETSAFLLKEVEYILQKYPDAANQRESNALQAACQYNAVPPAVIQ